MNMFKVTWIDYGELDFASSDFCSLTYDVSSHNIFYETCNGIRHILRCDFSSIFDELHSIVSSVEFQNEVPYEDGCDGDWYKFEYTLNGKEVHYEGYIYGLRWHEDVVSLIKSCAKDTLEDEKKLLQHKCTDNEMQDIIESRKEIEEDFLDFWVDIETRLEDDFSNCWNGILSEIQLPNGFIKCSKCNSIIHNKYFKNRKYWGRVWLSDDELGDYEVEYDSGECPVCGQLNNELPYTGIECQPDDPVDFDSGAVSITLFENKCTRFYSADELGYLLIHLSDEDRIKISDCQFKAFECGLDDDSGDIYYYLTAYRNTNEVGTIDIHYHSNTYWDLIDNELKTTNDIPSYTYTMTLNKDLEEGSKNPFDNTFDNIKSPFDNSRNPFDNSRNPFNNIKNPFSSSKFRCKKCGKVFCTCNKSFF